MSEIESENSIEQQYADWHPETPEAPVINDAELSLFETQVSEDDLKSEAAGVHEYMKNPEPGESPETKKRNLAREFYQRLSPVFNEKIDEIAKLFSQGKIEEARALGKQTIEDAKTQSVAFLGETTNQWFADFQTEENVAQSEPDKSKRSKLYSLATQSIDFIPVVGSMKMIGEGLVGKTMDGEKLSKSKRIWRATEGAVFLALDLTGVGIVEAEALKSGKLVTRSAALMRKVGMAREVYKPVYKTGRFLIENPATAKLADKSLEKIIQARKSHISTLVEKGKEVLFNSVAQEEPELAQVV